VRNQSKRCAECACGAGNLVEDVHEGVHLSQFLDVAADEISWYDATDELYHAVYNAAYTVCAILSVIAR
jgi:hypothetical protein